MKASLSLKYFHVELLIHGIVVYPPNLIPFDALNIVIVGLFPSHFS